MENEDYNEVKEPEVIPKDNRKKKIYWIALIVVSTLALIALLFSGKKEPKKVRVIKKTIIKSKAGKKKAKIDEEIIEEDNEEDEEEIEQKEDENDNGNDDTPTE